MGWLMDMGRESATWWCWVGGRGCVRRRGSCRLVVGRLGGLETGLDLEEVMGARLHWLRHRDLEMRDFCTGCLMFPTS